MKKQDWEKNLPYFVLLQAGLPHMAVFIFQNTSLPKDKIKGNYIANCIKSY